MDTAPVAPAPAQPDSAPATISAEQAAANKNDFAAFNEAHLAHRRGTPQARVEAPVETPPAETPAVPAPTVSKRQQQINDYERRIAEQAERIRALEARSASPAAPRSEPAQPPAPAPAKDPEWKRFVHMPDAPKLADFESVEEHTAAMALFIADQRFAERSTADQQRQHLEAIGTAQKARIDAFVGRLEAAKTANPEFVTALTDDVKALRPVSALAPEEPGGPRNIVAEQVVDSPHAPALLTYFSQHPDELARLDTMPPEVAALPPAVRVRAHIHWIVKEVAKLEGKLESPAAPIRAAALPSTVTAAPPPPPTLSRAGSTSDPKASALARGDFGTFDRLDLQERARKRSHA